MDVSRYLGHIPQIEQWIEESRLDAIVCGLGPSFWLLRYCNRKLLNDVRLFGVHDACRIMPVDDLVVMDSPIERLHPDYDRHKWIVEGRPKRVWIHDWHYEKWMPFIHASMKPVTASKKWWTWPADTMRVTHKGDTKPGLQKRKLMLADDHPHTGYVSPTGATTLAWEQGCRRIGVIGVDMMRGQHGTHSFCGPVDQLFQILAKQAHEAGGLIRSLSPMTALEGFKKWSLSASSLAPTSGSAQPEPNSSLPTPSASTPPAQSTSSSCELATESGPSASTARSQAVGSSAGQST